jgi:mono/diheme cytochrome c family protein
LSVADKSLPFVYRIMNANFRLGTGAQRIAELSSAESPEPIRREALAMLAAWDSPSPFDRVLWHHRPLARGRYLPPTEKADLPADSDLLASGDAKAGEHIYQRHAAQCVRCHGVDLAGTAVGPNLQQVGVLPPAKILESLLRPSAGFAEGFAPAADAPAISPMPAMGPLLTRRELRDLITFLGTLR